ncbi:MAG TPA: Hsp20/alpha crystallin family protein [Kiritimatiellia bacterium]|jgi:HSP20 family protein
MDAWTNSDGAVLSVDVPGIDPKDVAISVEGDMVSIEGERHARELKEGDAYQRRERSTGKFARLVTLPFDIDSERVSASYAHGVLTVTLPKVPEAKAARKKIDITTG